MTVSGGIAAGSGKTYTFTLPITVTSGLGLGTIMAGSESCALQCSYDSTSVYLRAGNKITAILPLRQKLELYFLVFNNGFCLAYATVYSHNCCGTFTYPITFNAVPVIIGKILYINGTAECYYTEITVSNFTLACNLKHCSTGNYIAIGLVT